jgi:hypothetical protein
VQSLVRCNGSVAAPNSVLPSLVVPLQLLF